MKYINSTIIDLFAENMVGNNMQPKEGTSLLLENNEDGSVKIFGTFQTTAAILVNAILINFTQLNIDLNNDEFGGHILSNAHNSYTCYREPGASHIRLGTPTLGSPLDQYIYITLYKTSVKPGIFYNYQTKQI